ncbi:MAG: amidohydrolase family protein, partial [Tateyamaria sp.]
MADVLVPTSLVGAPHQFGGVADGDCLRGTPVIDQGRLTGLTEPKGGTAKMVLPRLVEPHCHLDKCHTIQRLGQVGGDLRHAIARQYADKVNWDEDDLRSRASRGLAEAMDNGCAYVRSHVDWGDDAAPPLAWSVLVELAEDHTGLQVAALTSIDQWADPDFAKTVGDVMRLSDGVAGAFILDHGKAQAGLNAIFTAAADRSLMLDFHVDEGLGRLNGLERVADAAIEIGFDLPILCGHCVSLMDRTDSDFARIADKLAQAGIVVCALPITNLYLQGRTDGTPDRRGITRLRELRTAGLNVVVGSDNVADAFCPPWAPDPLRALAQACLTAHLDPPPGDLLPGL